MPCNQGTPSEEDLMDHLSMPLSHFSSSPAPVDAMTAFQNPPFPSPHIAAHSMSALATLRTSRMFNEFIHPSMLELNKLNISSTPTYIHRYHAAPDVVMEENVLVAGPSNVSQAGVEEDASMSSREVDLAATTGGMSEEGGSRLASASKMVKGEGEQPVMLLIPRLIRSPASQTEVSEVDPAESSAMAIDGGDDGLDQCQLQPGNVWKTIIWWTFIISSYIFLLLMQ